MSAKESGIQKDVVLCVASWVLMKSVSSHGSSSLLFLMMVMVWHFVGDAHKVMTALNVVLPSMCCGDFSAISYKKCAAGWCAKGWGQVIWSCKLSLYVHGENYILFELVFGFILIVDIHLSLAGSLFIFSSSGNRVVKCFELCWWCCCLQQRWKEKFFVNVGTDCGLTIAGFYYVCFSRSDGSVHGFYYDPNSRFVWLYSCP